MSSARTRIKLNRFIQEAKAASALNHPNILTVYEIGETDGTNYIVTELIDGKTLREHLSQKETRQLNAILKIGVQQYFEMSKPAARCSWRWDAGKLCGN